MVNAPVLQTERLTLRRPEAGDFDDWAAFCADPDTMRFLGGAQNRATAWRTMCTMAGAWDVRGFSMFSVIERVSGRWIGRIGPWQPEGWPGTEIGWGLSAEFAGKGYALEAARAAMDYAFDTLGWDAVIHTIHPDNAASIALAERLGSTNGGRVTLPAPLQHLVVDAWGQRAEDWRARGAIAG